MNRFSHIAGIIWITLTVFGCNDIIEYSPYDTNVVSRNININNAALISSNAERLDTLKFALCSDPHTSYDELKNTIQNINRQEGLQFIVCCGDVTDCGLSQEFIWYHEIINNSRYPVITVIGNHDYRSNGLKIFNRMFGPSNMSFICMGYNFIVFDDVVWENNNKSPKFDWLKTELGKSNLPCILLTHIPPWTDQLEGVYCLVFESLISKSNLILCLHGHQHSFSTRVFACVPAIVSDDIGDREYYIIKLYGIQHKIVRIRF